MMKKQQSMVLAYSMADPALWSMGVISTGTLKRGAVGPFQATIWSYYASKSMASLKSPLHLAEGLEYLSLDAGFTSVIALDADKKYIGWANYLPPGIHRLGGLTFAASNSDEVPYSSNVKYLQFNSRKSLTVSNSEGEEITTAFAIEQNLRLYY
jgi:hypothetical protein